MILELVERNHFLSKSQTDCTCMGVGGGGGKGDRLQEQTPIRPASIATGSTRRDIPATHSGNIGGGFGGEISGIK